MVRWVQLQFPKESRVNPVPKIKIKTRQLSGLPAVRGEALTLRVEIAPIKTGGIQDAVGRAPGMTVQQYPSVVPHVDG